MVESEEAKLINGQKGGEKSADRGGVRKDVRGKRKEVEAAGSKQERRRKRREEGVGTSTKEVGRCNDDGQWEHMQLLIIHGKLPRLRDFPAASASASAS